MSDQKYGLVPGLERFQLPDLSEPQPVVALLELLDVAVCPSCGHEVEIRRTV